MHICSKTIKKNNMKKIFLNNMNCILYFCFVAYYFVLSVIVLDKTMKDGYITFKLLNQLGMVEEPRLYE